MQRTNIAAALYKRIVQRGYRECAAAYAAARAKLPDPALALLTERLPNQARVLDIGCGAGIPITASLAERFNVVGVDICPQQIHRARQNVPNAKFIGGDILTQRFSRASFDAVVSFYALFHLPRAYHAALLQRLRQWLKPGAYMELTFGDHLDTPCSIEEDFWGSRMFWSYYASNYYLQLLPRIGYEILSFRTIDHGYHDKALPPESHLLIFGRATR